MTSFSSYTSITNSLSSLTNFFLNNTLIITIRFFFLSFYLCLAFWSFSKYINGFLRSSIKAFLSKGSNPISRSYLDLNLNLSKESISFLIFKLEFFFFKNLNTLFFLLGYFLSFLNALTLYFAYLGFFLFFAY